MIKVLFKVLMNHSSLLYINNYILYIKVPISYYKEIYYILLCLVKIKKLIKNKYIYTYILN